MYFITVCFIWAGITQLKAVNVLPSRFSPTLKSERTTSRIEILQEAVAAKLITSQRQHNFQIMPSISLVDTCQTDRPQIIRFLCSLPSVPHF